MMGRLPWSRSPPQPKTEMSLFLAKPRAVVSTFFRASGVWA